MLLYTPHFSFCHQPHRAFGYAAFLLVAANHAVAVAGGYLSTVAWHKAILLALLAGQVAITLSGVSPALLPFGSAVKRKAAAAQSQQ